MGFPRASYGTMGSPRLSPLAVAASGALLLLASCGGSEESPSPSVEAPSTYSVTAGGGACSSSQYSARVGVMPIVGRTSGVNHELHVTPLDAP